MSLQQRPLILIAEDLDTGEIAESADTFGIYPKYASTRRGQ